MDQQSRKNYILKLLPWLLFVLSIGIGIGLYIKPIPRGFDTFTFIVGSLTIFGAFMVAMSWNGLEDRIRRANEQQEKRVDKLEKKMKKILENVEYTKQMVDLTQQLCEPGYMATIRQHQQSKVANDVSQVKKEQ